LGKLFNLKKWLTVPETARHLATLFGEEVTEADVLRLALDGRLKLSVYFVNGTYARRGKVVRYSEAALRDAITSGNLPQDLKWHTWPPGAMAALRSDLPPDEAEKSALMLMSLQIDDDRYLTLDDKVRSIDGVWDLPMIGGEELDIEHGYQKLTGGPSVTSENIDGAFVQRNDGEMWQLQEDYDDNQYQAGSNAALDGLKQHIADKNIGAAEAEELLNRHKEARKKFLEERKEKRDSGKDSQNYFPAGGLPTDSVLVVRTDALREFEASISGASANSDADEASTLGKAAKPKGCTKGEILAADWPLPNGFNLEGALSDVPKWLMSARVSRGTPGRGSSIWNPVQIAVCLVTEKAVNKTAVDHVIRRHFAEFIDEWEHSAEML